MTATSLQFGPEWMRTKQQTTPSTTRPPTSILSPASQSPVPPAPPGTSSYSSLLTQPVPAPPEKQDSVNPFMYSKEEMLQVWKDGGGRGGLGLEVELWEGVVKEISGEPIGLKEISEAERKLFSLPLNSDLRRRQSHDYLPTLTLATGDRPKLPHSSSSTHNPLTQQRYGALGVRRRKDEDGGPPLTVPRRLSMSSVSSPLGGPLSPTAGLPSPRTRLGSGTHGLDTIPNASDGSWRKRDTDTARPGGHTSGSHDFDERDEDAQEGGNKQISEIDSNGPLKDPDVSRSVSDRSMAPSPPSVRGDSGRELSEDLTIKLGGMTLTDEQRNTGGVPSTLGTMIDGNTTSTTKGGISAARPPGLEEDLANVSWSYRDPKGNIQGPFAATLMQKWYDDGYFTPDLLMKRTHVDTDWTPVGELCLRAGNEKLFFSSFADHGPPGLGPRPTIPSDGQPYDHFGQPIGQTMSLQLPHPSSELSANGSPLHSFLNSATNRPSTLDSYLGVTSPNQSGSPASAFSAAIGPMPSVSPDLPFGVGGPRSAFGNNSLEPTFGGRVGALDSQPSSLGARGVSTPYNSTNDHPYGPRLGSLGHRGIMFDNQGFSGIISPGNATSPWTSGLDGSAPRNPDTSGLTNLSTHRPSLNTGTFGQSPVTNVPGFNDMGSNDSHLFGPDGYNYSNTGFAQLGRGTPSTEALPPSFGPIGPGVGLREQGLRPHLDLDGISLNNRHGLDENPRAPASFVNGYGPTSPLVHEQGSAFGLTGNLGGQQQGQHPGQHIPPPSAYGQSPVATSPLAVLQPQQQSVANLPVAQPPWGVPETSAQPRPRPFDAPHPTSRNVVRTPITSNESSNEQQTSDWYNASRPDLIDGWGDISATQTPDNDQSNDANQGQQSGWTVPPRASPPFDHVADQGRIPRLNPTPPAPQLAQPQPHEPAPQAAPKKRGSGPAAQASQLPTTKPAPATSPKPPSPQPPVSTQPKAAWSTNIRTEDEVKPVKQTGLREIQEAEAKRLEAKKIADRERERPARSQSNEETQTYTASWGLPTSQAGTARSTPKEQPPAASSPVAPMPVWTNAGKPPQAKRTMKEILEEEERRKKAAAKDKETAAAAARRAYAESANKTPSGPSAGGVWTTVGSGGKTNPNPSTTRHVSGSAQPASPSPAAVRSPNGNPTTRAPSVSPQNAKPSASKPSPTEDGPVPPSPEFMKWLREAVRGFNPGFNTEEFMAMLLTFSLDFPSSTVEMIQDMVYMNSATLDGRRFAADFCSKRKADAANRPKGWGANAGGKTPSLADVVKTQPKPAQAEFGFKMVKKKGRGNALR